ncbi:hypothetical protein ABIA85_008861 [Bradyrhizobium sp. LA6.10]|uniref:hypothetical protein n=1 Tax=Bradyrhizobium sp. LA6.10 TaxID=3156318 RepID=UPI00339B43DD
MADALQVIDMRLRQIAAGAGTADEIYLMARREIKRPLGTGAGHDFSVVIENFAAVVRN